MLTPSGMVRVAMSHQAARRRRADAASADARAAVAMTLLTLPPHSSASLRPRGHGRRATRPADSPHAGERRRRLGGRERNAVDVDRQLGEEALISREDD